MSLRIRVALLVASVVTVVVAAVGYMAVRSADAELTEEVDIDLLTRAEVVQDQLLLTGESTVESAGSESAGSESAGSESIGFEESRSNARGSNAGGSNARRFESSGSESSSLASDTAGEATRKDLSGHLGEKPNPSEAGEWFSGVYEDVSEDWYGYGGITSDDWSDYGAELWYGLVGTEWLQSLSEQFDPRSKQRDTLGKRLREDPLGFLVSFDVYAQVVLEIEDSISRDGESDISRDEERDDISGGEVVLRIDDDIGVVPRTETLAKARDQGPVLETITPSANQRWSGPLRVITVEASDGVYVQLARSLDEVDRAVDDLTRRVLIFGLLAVGLAVAVAWFLAGQAVRPILRLADTAEQVAETGDLERPVDSYSSGEVGRLARSFHTMLGALAASRRQQHRLVMDASHELRTPLTSLRTNVDVLRRNSDLPATERDAVLEDLDAELVELSDLAAELVDLAADVPTDEELDLIHLADVVNAVTERARRRTGRQINVRIRRDIAVEGRREALSRAVRNLVDNAVKFSDAGAVDVVVDGGAVTVHDSGPGVPEADRERIFERFHRLESDRDKPGSGLGLAIVRQVAEAHSGTVSVGSSPLGGAAVELRIPEIDD